MPCVLGVDSSTQATKVERRDVDTGELLGAGRAPHPPTAPPCSEQDPRAWWDALVTARAQADAADAAVAISIAAQQHGLVVTDSAGDPLRPAKLWNDTESAPDAGWLRDHLDGGAAAWARACGSVPVAALTIAKLSWLHRREPDTFAAMARVMLPHDWLAWRATGDLVSDRGDASGTGYWSPREGEYRWDLLAIVDGDRDWAALVPPVASPETATGTGDNMAAALGVGLQPGDLMISLGTSGTVTAVSTVAAADATGAVAGFADATGRFLPLVCTLNATKVTDAFARVLGVDLAGLDELAGSTAAGADGLVLVPYLDGERTPDRPDATGTLTGVRGDVTREQVARAAYEGVVCGLLDGLDALRAVGVAVDGGRLFLVGGGSRSPVYRQVVADLAQRPVMVPAAAEPVALGAAVQAAARHTGAPIVDVQSAWQLGQGTTVDPGLDPTRAAQIRAAYTTATAGSSV